MFSSFRLVAVWIAMRPGGRTAPDAVCQTQAGHLRRVRHHNLGQSIAYFPLVVAWIAVGRSPCDISLRLTPQLVRRGAMRVSSSMPTALFVYDLNRPGDGWRGCGVCVCVM